MAIRVNVTDAEKTKIQSLARNAGLSVNAYILDRVLYAATPLSALLSFSEQQAAVAQDLNDLVTAAIQNKVVYEEQVLELLERMTELEQITAAALKEVSQNGYPRQ